MINSLKIERFRSISDLSLEDLGRVNIFVGENGCGKTSVLESVCLIAEPTHPARLHALSNWRELPPPGPGNDAVFSTLFHNGNYKTCPTFTFEIDGGTETLTIAESRDVSGVAIPYSANLSGSQDSDVSFVPAVTFAFIDSRKFPYNSRAVIISGQLQQFFPNPDHRGLGCFYIHARRSTSLGEMANILTMLSKNKTMEKMLKAINSFHGGTISIEAGISGQHPIVLVDTGLPVKLPINVLGDGYCRMSLIAAGLFSGGARIVAIDEIDSGLHTSIMGQFWESIGKLARQYDKQVFCTTHSEEMLSQTLSAFETNKAELRIFRIDRTDDGETVATKYTYDSYFRAVQAEADIR